MIDTEKNNLTNGSHKVIDPNQIIDLLSQLEGNHFWGTVKLYYQGGRLVQGEVTQTLKQLANETNILVIVKE